MPQTKKILILGGGFGGINILKSIQNKFKNEPNVKISLVSKDNFFVYTLRFASYASKLNSIKQLSPQLI